MFFKRFYLYKSMYSYKPRTMMLTCMILAFKAEEVNCNPLLFLSRVEGADPTKVMEYEISLLEGLKYQMHTYSPFDSLEGLSIILRLSPEFVKEKVEPILCKSYLTDASLIYSPGIITSAAIYLSNKDLLKALNLSQEQAKKIEEAAEVIKTAKETSQVEAYAIGMKLKLFEKACPEFVKYMEESKKKKTAGSEPNKRRASEGESVLQIDPAVPKKPKDDIII